MRRYFRRSPSKHNPLLIAALLVAAVIYNFFSPSADKPDSAPAQNNTAAVQSTNTAGSKQTAQTPGQTVSEFAWVDKTIPDGDTISVKTKKDGRKLRVRFLGIDTPETKQLHGPESQKTLENMIRAADYQVELRYQKTDQYGRAVALVFAKGKNLNLEQIKNGSAWYYRQFAKDLRAVDPEAPAAFDKAEKEARAERRGLWADRNPQAPWDWRKQNPRSK
jgi:endonuclease YncB( thermonuclease family)